MAKQVIEVQEKSGFDMNKVVPVLVVVLMVLSFYVGNLSAKVAYLEKGGVTVTANNNAGTGEVAGQAAPATEISKDKFDELAKGDRVFGNKNAKVAIVEFSDFQCPFCKSFVDTAYAQIKKDYVDTGKVKVIFRHFPLTAIHPFAMDAALASECAAEQGKFAEYHDKLFANQTAISKDDLKKYAGEIKLNTGKFNGCLDTAKYKDRVDADMKLASENGINGTPGFFVNGKLISGAQPFDVFKTAIDAAL